MNSVNRLQHLASAFILILLLLTLGASCQGVQPEANPEVEIAVSPVPPSETSLSTPLPKPTAATSGLPIALATTKVALVKDGHVLLWDEATKQLQTIVSSGDVQAVWLSPDGQMVAYTRRAVVEKSDTSNNWFEQSSVWLVDINSTNPTELVSAAQLRQLLNIDNLESTAVEQLFWLPEGNGIAFNGISYWVQGEGASHALPQGLFTADTQTLAIQVLIDADSPINFLPSADGRQIALMSTTGLSFINSDGSYLRSDVLIYPEAGVPTPIFPKGIWTTDGTAFYLAAPTDSDSPFEMNFNIWQVPSDGTSAEVIATGINDSHPRSFSFSPDGRLAAFIQGSGEWHINPLSSEIQPLHLSYKIDEIFWENLHWSPANIAYSIHKDTLQPLCRQAALDSDICGEPIKPGGIIHAFQWLDNDRFLLMTREPYALYLAHLDGTTIPIVAWKAEEGPTARSFSTLLAQASESALSSFPSEPTLSTISPEDALKIADQGQELYEEHPLLGLRLMLEAWALLPDENQAAKDRIMIRIQEMTARGRLVKLAENLRNIIVNPDKSSFLIFPEGDQGLFPGQAYAAELRLASTGQLLESYEDYWTGDFSPKGTYFWLETSPFSAAVEAGQEMSINLYQTQSLDLIKTITRPQGTSIQLTFSPDETHLIVNYIGPQDFTPAAPGFLFRLADGETILLPDSFFAIQFSPNDHAYIVNYVQHPDELRFTAQNRLISLGEIDGATLFFDTSFLVIGYTDGSSEMRRTEDGTVITPLTDAIWGLFPNPNGINFVVSYKASPAELRQADGGERITTLSDTLATISFSPDGSYFTTAYYAEPSKPAELRRAVDGHIIATLERPLHLNIFESPFTLDGSHLVVDYIDAPSEWRRSADFALLFTFPGDIERLAFSPDGAYFAVSYVSGKPELRRTSDGQLVATLACDSCHPAFSPDGKYLLHGGQLWSLETKVLLLANLGGVETQFFNTPDAYRLIVRSGRTIFHIRAYLIDVAWLKAVGGDPAGLAGENLASLLCQKLLSPDKLSDSTLIPYLEPRLPQACDR